MSLLFFSIVAGTFAWNLDLHMTSLNDNPTHTCANVFLPSSNGLLIMNTSIFTELRLRLVTTNLAVTPSNCHSTPLLLFINAGEGSMASDECRPFCGPPTTCNLENQLEDLTIWNCHCPGGTCDQIAFAIAPGAFVDNGIPAQICHVRYTYWWHSLTHWGRATHICVGKLTIIGSDNGLSPDRRQTIIWTNGGTLLIGPIGTNFSDILIEILTFSFTECYWKFRLRNGGHFFSASMC